MPEPTDCCNGCGTARLMLWFYTARKQLSIQASPYSCLRRDAGGRPAALEAFADGGLVKFNTKAWHAPTDYERWQTTNASYEIIYKDLYEPWCILDRYVLICTEGCRYSGSIAPSSARTNALGPSQR